MGGVTQMAQKRSVEAAKARQVAREGQGTGEAQKDRTDALKADLDEVLDELDDVLEENAEQFVKDYVQKGGE